MASIRTPLLPAALLLAACQSPKVADLAQNEQIYTFVGYHTRAPGDKTAFVAPLVDARDGATLPAAQGGYPITYDGDGRWARPVLAMVDEVLMAELGQSGLFSGLRPQAGPEDVVVAPSLVTFLGGAMELEHGARSFAEVGIRVQVHGPAGSDGQRPLLHDEVYGERHVSNPARVPPSTYVLAGRALHTTVQQLLAGLDSANVGRSHVPAQPVR